MHALADLADQAEHDERLPGESRTGPRVSLLLRAAKLVSPTAEFLCILRDVSTRGLKARLFHRLPDERPLKLELGNGQRFSVEPVWEKDSHAGFRFLHDNVAVSELVRESTPFPRRSLRLKLDRDVVVHDGERQHAARLCDISLLGVLIETAATLPLRKEVTIDHGRIALGAARVRWRRGRLHGLVLQRSLTIEQLAMLIAHVHQVGDDGALAPLALD
ncbi:PilZ domain-containing protein [Novosphingobium kunmingense]|uniref:PilZ domain-containing protein n=1 Tax=Novosphingobium kunmingense TaxID=1211806 RepID=A0A2N0H5G4_9SPHN|nr:PilZ domain-containing protein [Novosphingobium kunmingense]PKB14169.1 PilZ domain-containing protein [Novosphingobium kunmingense]